MQDVEDEDLGSSSELTKFDIEKVFKMYKCEDTCMYISILNEGLKEYDFLYFFSPKILCFCLHI